MDLTLQQEFNCGLRCANNKTATKKLNDATFAEQNLQNLNASRLMPMKNEIYHLQRGSCQTSSLYAPPTVALSQPTNENHPTSFATILSSFRKRFLSVTNPELKRRNAGSILVKSGDIMPSKMQLFCEATSIRGIQKVAKSPTRFLKILWLIFVCIMTTILLNGVASLIYNYQLYETAWDSKTIMDDKNAPFPDITLCSHIPFSLEAREHWLASGSKHILTPKEFQTRLLNLSLTALDGIQQNQKFANRSEMLQFFRMLASYNNIETYYSSLTLQETYDLGHKIDMLFLCVIYEVSAMTVDEKCNMKFFNVQRMSHNEYLNCYTIRPNSEFITTIDRINIIVKLVPASHLDDFLQKVFYMEAFNRGEGLKIVIHEHGTYPDFGRKGFNVEPGKMNEIIYETIKGKLTSTPVKACVNDGAKLQHLENTYNYTQQHCLDNYLQKALIESCKCQISYMARLLTPDKAPYCFSFTKNNYTVEEMQEKFDTISCANNFDLQTKSMKESAQKSVCLPRCDFISYKTDLSITQWHPASNILDMMTSVTNIYSELTENPDHTKTQQLEDRLRLLLTGDGSRILEESRYKTILNNSNAFTYVNLKRSSFDSILKTEKLVLNSSILASRIGGLCSLCIGLTAAFICEIIEFIYMSLFGSSLPNSQQHHAIANSIGNNDSSQEHVRLTYIDPWNRRLIANEEEQSTACCEPTDEKVLFTSENVKRTVDKDTSLFDRFKLQPVTSV